MRRIKLVAAKEGSGKNVLGVSKSVGLQHTRDQYEGL